MFYLLKKPSHRWLAAIGLMWFLLTAPFNAWAMGPEGAMANQCRQVVDSVGRVVRVPVRIDRIACLYAFIGHVVTMLGRGEDIVAVSSGLKRDSLLLRICPAIRQARVPKAQGAVNMEELLNASPDILFVPGDTLGNRGLMKKLDQFEIPTLVVDFDSIQSQQAAIALIGDALGEGERARAFISYYQSHVAHVQSLTRDIPEERRPRLYHAVNESIRTTLVKGLASDWIDVTGGRNVAALQPLNMIDGKNYVSLEQILVWNPEVIITNEAAAQEEILTDPRWAGLDAVSKGRVYHLPMGISRWGHPGSMETPLAILWTAKKLYPERFGMLDMVTETRFFYKQFFNYQLPDEMITKILSGKLVRKPKHSAPRAY